MRPSYLITGNYPTTKLNLRIHLPAVSDFTYEFSSGFNLSKDVGGSLGKVNVVAFFMRKTKDNDAPMGTADDEFLHSMTRESLVNIGLTTINFDHKRLTTYVAIIHNDVFSYDMILNLFNNLNESSIKDITAENSPKISNAKSNDALLTPKRIGMSLILK